MSKERHSPVVVKGGGEVGANAKQLLEGTYGRLIRGEMEQTPLLVVCSAPGTEPGIQGSIKLTDHAINVIQLAKNPSVGSSRVHEAFEPIYDRFISLARALNLNEEAYQSLLSRYYEDIVAKKAHSGEPEVIMARLLADAIPGGVFINSTNYLEIDRDGKFIDRDDRSKRARLNNEIGDGQIGIMPGFVVSGPDGRATTLSRGGSDASAGEISKILIASVCIIYTNTNGVRTADPRFVNGTRPNLRLTYQELAEATLGGAYVVHERTIPPLEKSHIPLQVLHFKDEGDGTSVYSSRKPSSNELAVIITGTKNRSTLTVSQHGINTGSGFLAHITGVLAAKGIPIHDVATATNSASFTTDREGTDLSDVVATLNREMPGAIAVQVSPGSDSAAISVIGENLPVKSSEVLKRIGEALAEIGVQPRQVSFTGLNCTIYVPKNSFEASLQAVHDRIINQ